MVESRKTQPALCKVYCIIFFRFWQFHCVDFAPAGLHTLYPELAIAKKRSANITNTPKNASCP